MLKYDFTDQNVQIVHLLTGLWQTRGQVPVQSPKPQKAPKREKRNLASGLVTKILRATTPPHPTTTPPPPHP